METWGLTLTYFFYGFAAGPAETRGLTPAVHGLRWRFFFAAHFGLGFRFLVRPG